MFRADHPTAVGILAAPSAPGTPGYYAPDTVVTSEHLNMLVEELMALLTAAGITPDKANRAQVLAAIRALTRIKLTSTLNLYVSPTGSDANDGLTSGTPFATLTQAWATLVSGYDLNGLSARINMMAGTHLTSGLCYQAPVGNGTVEILGNAGTPANVVISVTNSNCLEFGSAGIVTVNGVKLIASGSSSVFASRGNGLVASLNSRVYLANIEFGACGHAHIATTQNGVVQIAASAPNSVPMRITGGAGYHAYADNQSLISLIGGLYTLTGTPAFTDAFAGASWAEIFANDTVFNGAATGKRFHADYNALIATNGGGASYLPGNVSGTTANGGIYV